MRAEINLGRWLLALLVLSSASACYTSSEEGAGGQSHFLECTRNAQCEHLGPAWSCIEGQCQTSDEPAAASRNPGAAPATNGSGGNGGPAIAASGPSQESPLVVLVVDTSGSMERLADCTCSTPGCEECLPDCRGGARNRWADTLETLTGTFQDFACNVLNRSTFEAGTYDFGYYLPYHQPFGAQRDDGLLDQYSGRLRFGLATFDGWDTWIGAPPLVTTEEFDFEVSNGQAGLWSYNPAREIPGFTGSDADGSFVYPNTTATYFMDTGIRSARAESGALLLATDAPTARAINAAIQSSLLAVRPYGGTPIASALHDLYSVLTQDPSMAGERARNTVPHVILITDGYPDDDYRTFGCDCSERGDCPEGLSQEQVASMRCPYPTPEEAARALRCGSSGGTECGAQVAELHVVSFGNTDAAVIDRLDAIAVAGGAAGARFAGNSLELRAELDAVLSEIVR